MLDHWQASDRLRADSVSVELEAGRAYDIKLEYYEGERDAGVRLAWNMPGAKPPFEEALEAARGSDVVVFVGGLTGDVEGEEMTVNYPGFAGGDRTDLRLPSTQRKLLEALHATGKPVVLVLTTGSALAIDWAQAAPAGDPGGVVSRPARRQCGGGRAVRRRQPGRTPAGNVLQGGREAAGVRRLRHAGAHLSLLRAASRCIRSGMGCRTRRFAYSDLRLDRARRGPQEQVKVTMKVKNTGDRAGDEVVQLYLHPLKPQRERALKDLRGFERLTLQPGEERDVSFTFTPRNGLCGTTMTNAKRMRSMPVRTKCRWGIECGHPAEAALGSQRIGLAIHSPLPSSERGEAFRRSRLAVEAEPVVFTRTRATKVCELM